MGLSWAEGGKALFAGVVSTDYLITRIGLDGKTHVLLERKSGLIAGPSSSPDGRYLAFYQAANQPNLWLLENF
jgi:Tol biopolymer transport system component